MQQRNTMHTEDRMMAARVGKTVLILFGLMIVLILVANIIA